MSKEIIEVLEYISGKIGVAIDFTSENVWPQVMEVLSRYGRYEITANVITLLVCFILMAICVRALRMVFKDYCKYKNEEVSTVFWRVGRYGGATDMCVLIVAFSYVVLFIAFIVCAFHCNDLLRWIYIPEIQILDMLDTYINTR